jgi:hypothetical protein
MTNQTDSTSAALADIRTILAAIAREAGNRGIEEIVDLANRADTLAARLIEDANRS